MSQLELGVDQAPHNESKQPWRDLATGAGITDENLLFTADFLDNSDRKAEEEARLAHEQLAVYIAEIIEKPVFQIQTMPDVDWAVAKVLGWRDRLEGLKTWFADETRKAKASEESFLAWFGPQIAAVVIAENAGKKTKSLSTPSGIAALVKKAEGFEIEKDGVEAYEAWCLENVPTACSRNWTFTDLRLNPDFSRELHELCESYGIEPRSVLKVDKNIVNLHFKNTGELPDACNFVGGFNELKIRPSKVKAVEF